MIFFVFGKSILMARIANCVMGALTCVIVYHIGKKIFSSTVGKIAAFLVAFYPYLIAYTGDLLAETFLTFIISIAILFVLLTSENPTWKNIIVTGILIGLAGLTKSTVLPFFFLACGWIWWQTKSFRTGFMVGVFTLLTITPWTFRNYFYHDKNYIMPVNTPWYSLYGSSNDKAFWHEMSGEFDRPQDDKMTAPAIPNDWEYISSLPIPERDRLCKEKALTWIRDNPDKFLALTWMRFKHFWRLYPMMAYKWQKYIAMATSGIYIPLCLLGIVISWQKFSSTSLLIALFAAYSAVHIFFAIGVRHRIPIDPYIIIFASYTLYKGWTSIREWTMAYKTAKE
jgi:4-amino-4-deoxy-L-arabinose transferase-like glycosyltransferase